MYLEDTLMRSHFISISVVNFNIGVEPDALF